MSAQLDVVLRASEDLQLAGPLTLAVDRLVSASRAGSAGAGAAREAAHILNGYADLLERRPEGADIAEVQRKLDEQTMTLAIGAFAKPQLDKTEWMALPSAPPEPTWRDIFNSTWLGACTILGAVAAVTALTWGPGLI
jgi:hypothetical protein